MELTLFNRGLILGTFKFDISSIAIDDVIEDDFQIVAIDTQEDEFAVVHIEYV